MLDSQAPTFRTARPDEIARAASICPPAPELPGEGPVGCFVAVDERAGEKIVGAVFWRSVPEEGKTPVGVTFEWAMIPEFANTPVETDFLIALVTEIQLGAPDARWLSPSTCLPEGHPQVERLLQAAFQQDATWIHHSAALADIANWLAKFPPNSSLPATAPQAGHLVPLKEVLCGDKRPLRQAHLDHGFETAHSPAPTLFDARCSVLFMKEEEVIAACLANVSNGHMNLAALHLPVGPVQLLPEILRQVISRAELFAPPVTLGFTLHPEDPPAGLPALLQIPAFERTGTSRNFRRELHFPG